MPAHEWATAPQMAYLHTMFPSYLAARDKSKNKLLTCFWVLLNEGFFEHFSPEVELGISLFIDGVTPTDDELKALGEFASKMKEVSTRHQIKHR